MIFQEFWDCGEIPRVIWFEDREHQVVRVEAEMEAFAVPDARSIGPGRVWLQRLRRVGDLPDSEISDAFEIPCNKWVLCTLGCVLKL